jgi:quinol monooxygenase YgiN
VPTPTDDRPELLTVIATMRALPGKEQDLRDALVALVNYDLHQGVEDPALFCFYENWESGAALDAHLQAPHLTDFAGRLEELLDGGADGLVIRRVKRIA